MGLSFDLTQNQSLKQSLTLNQLQSLELLSLSTPELLERIQKEVLENPLLEGPERQRENLKLKENYIKRSELQTKKQVIEDTLQSPITLSAYLTSQLLLLKLNQEEMEISEVLLSALDERGYLVEDETKLLPKIDLKKITKVLKIIQNLEPIGCGARSLQEALCIQAQALRKFDENTKLLLEYYFDDLIHLNFDKILKESRLTHRELKLSLDFIRTLEPHPASQYNTQIRQVVVPDIFVHVLSDESIQVTLNKEIVPQVSLNATVLSLEKSIEKNSKDYEYFKNKIQSARALLLGIEKRNETLYKVVLSICKFQKKFFLKKDANIQALNLKQIASDIGLHESTISRTLSHKYLQCAKGTFELKYFVSAKSSHKNSTLSLRGHSNELENTNKFIQERIEKLIDQEFIPQISSSSKKFTNIKIRPLSDEDLRKLLSKEGIDIARRTVTKYRKLLNIPSAPVRLKIKQYRLN